MYMHIFFTHFWEKYITFKKILPRSTFLLEKCPTCAVILSATEDFFGNKDPLCEENSFVLSSDNSAYKKNEKMSVKYPRCSAR